MNKELKPAYLADADPNRALLDRRVVCDLLGFDEEVYVSRAPPGRQVVRGAVGARGQGASEGRQAGCLGEPMARLEGSDRRHFEIIPHPTVKGENALGLFVASLSTDGYVMDRYWDFAEVEEALQRYRLARGQE